MNTEKMVCMVVARMTLKGMAFDRALAETYENQRKAGQEPLSEREVQLIKTKVIRAIGRGGMEPADQAG